jgi:hypothetical protein
MSRDDMQRYVSVSYFGRGIAVSQDVEFTLRKNESIKQVPVWREQRMTKYISRKQNLVHPQNTQHATDAKPTHKTDRVPNVNG